VRLPYVLWDANALAKRYIAAAGTPTVDQRVLSKKLLTAAQSALRHEIIDGPGFVVLDIEFHEILDGIDLIQRHNLNSDAAMLRTFIKHARLLSPSGVSALAASDKRLLRAAGAEGLQTLNAEALSAADLPAFLKLISAE